MTISPTQCVFSNFVRFRQPNPTEMSTELWFQTTIQRTLDTIHGGKYSHCYYQWCGYSYYTYDYMYCYKTYNIPYMFYVNTIYDILHNSVRPSRLSELNEYQVQYYADGKNQRLCSVWNQFRKQTITFVP